MFQSLTFLIFVCDGLWAKKVNRTSYKDYQIWRVDINNENISSEFENMISNKDVWHRSDDNIDILLNGNETEYWTKYLQSQNIRYEVRLRDVQEAIEKEDLLKNGEWRRAGNIKWNSYPKLYDIYAYLKSVAAANPDYCTLRSLAKTTHKKDISMLKLSNGNQSNEALLINGGMHGREWISVLSVLYFIEHIAWNFTKQPAYIRNRDWYIIPVVNPDGYEYSMLKDRMWRKNRRRFSGPCDGVDLNRNFDFHWGTRDTSPDHCAATFCGPTPFSEIETQAIRFFKFGQLAPLYNNVRQLNTSQAVRAGTHVYWLRPDQEDLTQYKPGPMEDLTLVFSGQLPSEDLVSGVHFTGYVDVHSYGSAIIIPWVFDGKPTRHADVHVRVTTEMVMAMRKVDNVHFRAGRVNQLKLRKGSGQSVDWAYSQGINFAIAIETRGTEFGLPPNEMEMAAREIVAGLDRLAEYAV